MFLMLTLVSTINCCLAKKAVVATKKKFSIEVNVAHQNYVSYKKICCGNKKIM